MIKMILPLLIRRISRWAAATEARWDDALLGYDWPGNVRELQNIVERMILLRDGKHLTLADVPGILRQGTGFTSHPTSLPFQLPDEGLDLVELEKNIIIASLKKMDGNQSATARYLNIPRHVLLYRLDKYGIEGNQTVFPE